MKRVLHIISYSLNIVFIIVAIVAFCKRNEFKEPTEQEIANRVESMKKGIVEKECAELPLYIQEFNHVSNITIDSLVFTSVEPYRGYLATTWEYEKLTEPTANNGYSMKYKKYTGTVYVELYIDAGYDSYSWEAKWKKAYTDVVLR